MDAVSVGKARVILIGALGVLLPLAAAAALSPQAAAAPLTEQATPTLETPVTSEIALASPFVDSILTASAARVLARTRATAEWGGAIQATNGETVTIFFSDSYPVDQTLALKWADFMTTLVHGSELSTVSVYIAPLAEVERYCGNQSIACYSPDSLMIVAPGEDYDAQTSAEGVLTHEYGHHIAESRLNPPFATIDYGTKRWASYENVCARAKSGELFPGAEDAQHYLLNPGEAFAETYRVLNEQKSGATVEAWNVVSTLLYPDPTALALLEQDVTQPWTPAAAVRKTVTLTKSVRSKNFVISTPFDGTLTLTGGRSGSARVTFAVANSSGTLASRTIASRAATSISSTVCGQRTYTVHVKLSGTVTKKTKTTFTLAVTKP